jgi:hypothetical protein
MPVRSRRPPAAARSVHPKPSTDFQGAYGTPRGAASLAVDDGPFPLITQDRSRMKRVLPLGLAAALALAACNDQDPTGTSTPAAELAAAQSAAYVISFDPASAGEVATAIGRAGGKVKKLSGRAGLATATASTADFATRVRGSKGVKSVAQDMVVQWVPKQQFRIGVDAGSADTPTGSTERWFPTQWNLQAIHAPEAWATGQQGKGARVAVLDGGIWDQHVDIAPNIDTRRSTSFVPACRSTATSAPSGTERTSRVSWRPRIIATTSAPSVWHPKPRSSASRSSTTGAAASARSSTGSFTPLTQPTRAAPAPTSST